jgi:hypothetical protein
MTKNENRQWLLSIRPTGKFLLELALEALKRWSQLKAVTASHHQDRYREVGISSGNQALTRCAFHRTEPHLS